MSLPLKLSTLLPGQGVRIRRAAVRRELSRHPRLPTGLQHALRLDPQQPDLVPQVGGHPEELEVQGLPDAGHLQRRVLKGNPDLQDLGGSSSVQTEKWTCDDLFRFFQSIFVEFW